MRAYLRVRAVFYRVRRALRALCARVYDPDAVWEADPEFQRQVLCSLRDARERIL